jgi:hypothetical protein
MARSLIWISDQRLQGWACSECGWNFPVPSLLSDPEAKSAYDRLAAGKFRDHNCAEYPSQGAKVDGNGFDQRARRLIIRGFKPKDAVEITLQEITLEFRSDPARIEQARRDSEDFLRRVKDGLI